MTKKVSVEQFLEKMTEMQPKLETKLGKALAECCSMVAREAQESMTNTEIDYSKSYYTHNSKIAHHPSKGGNPPAVDTGTLRRSITFTVDEKNLVGHVGSTLQNPPYGAYLELAEYGSSKMQPRPWLKPALDKKEKEILETIKGALND